jgi:hypothetical protein
MNERSEKERVVVVHTAGTTTEAMVIRGLLESEGISSPGSVSHDPFPLRETPEGTHGVEVYALESRAGEAKKIIAEHLRTAKQQASDAAADRAGDKAEDEDKR